RGMIASDQVSLAPQQRLNAWHKGTFTLQAVTWQGAGTKPLPLHISLSHAARQTARLVDAAGKPVPDAVIEVWHRPWMPPPNLGTPQQVRFDGQPTLRSDAAGRFQTPPLEPDGEYRTEVRGAGVPPGRTSAQT